MSSTLVEIVLMTDWDKSVKVLCAPMRPHGEHGGRLQG